MKIDWHNCCKWLIPLIAAGSCIPLKIYASDSTNLVIGIIVLVIASVGLITQLRWPANYNPLEHYDWQIYTKPRPDVLVVTCNLLACCVRHLMILNQLIKL